MGGKLHQRVNALLRSLLVEEGHARECAHRAQEMAENGLDGAAAASLRISHHHRDAAVNLRAMLATLLPSEGPALRAKDLYVMSLDRFRDHLESLALGDVKSLTRAEFEQMFADGEGPEDKGLAAINLAEACSCRLLFRQSERAYAVFTRRQHRHDVRSSSPASLGA